MLAGLLTPAALGVVGAILVVIVVVTIVVKRYKIVDPDTAMIIVGNRGKKDEQGNFDLSGQKVITGGGIFVWPFIQRPYEMSLRSRRLTLNTVGQTVNGITLQVRAVAVIKVGGGEEMIRAAAQRFLSQQDEIETSAQEVLSGSLRSILGGLDVISIISDRQKVAQQVLDAATEALQKQGLTIDTLQIQELNDSTDYLANIGRPEAAQIRRKAEVADTEANREAEEARIAAESVILDKQREFSLKEAAVKTEIDRAAAVAEAAKPLEAAEQRRYVVEQETSTAEKEAQLVEQRLNAEVRKQADAEAYRITTLAEANKSAKIVEANAEREEREALAQAARIEGESSAAVTTARGEAEAGVLSATGLAEAAALNAKGKAEAEVLSAKGLAEAEAIKARGEALAAESQAVLAQQLIASLPDIMGNVATAYAGIDNMTIVSADGANKVSGDVMGSLTGMTEMLKDSVGIDLPALITGQATGRAIGQGLAEGGGIPTPPPSLD